MEKKVIIKKQIHSSFSSYSSSDIILNIITSPEEIDFEIKVGYIVKSKNFPFLNSETIKFIEEDNLLTIINVTPDETFYRKALHNRKPFSTDYPKTQEFKDLVKSYTDLGWGIEDYFNTPEFIAYIKRVEKRKTKKAKEKGLVLYMTYNDIKEMPISIYQGGLSDDLFNSEEIQNYLKNHPYIYGWIGNSSTRTAVLDKAIEEGLKQRNLSNEKIANWLTSTDGRHFAEKLYGKTLENQLDIIEKSLNGIFNIALIYSSKFHEGTFESTQKIKNDYEKQGILLPEDNSEYDREAHFKLIKDFFNLIK